MTSGVNAREMILEILLEIDEGEHSHIAIRNALSKYQFLPKQERAFITRVCEGTLEYRIQIDYIIDAHTHLTEFQGYEIKKATNEVFAEVNAPILVTLAARHNEMDEYIRHRGFNGTILSLEELLGEID